jgi:hypothetical protein
MLSGVENGPATAKRAWARLAGLSGLERTQVFVDSESPLCPRHWIGILALDGTVTASVPRPDLEGPVTEALAGLTSHEATTPAVVRPRLPPTRAVLGPARLFYPPVGFRPVQPSGIEVVVGDEAEALFAAVAADELDESGLRNITSPAFASRSSNGDLAAVCGYRRWPNGAAHLGVLAHPAYRRQGHARRAAAAAIARAVDEQLLPQWRARPPASQAVARSLGLIELGAQLSFEPA